MIYGKRFSYLEYDILITVTERAAERIGRIRGTSPVQHHRPLAGRQLFAELVPSTISRHRHTVQHDTKLTPLVHVEIIMSRIIRVQYQFLH